MFDLIKKSVYTGIGLAVMAKDKVRELGDELVKKGEMSEDEGREFVDELIEAHESMRDDLEEKIEEKVNRVLEKLNLARREDMEMLQARVRELEKQLAEKS
jgi:polyhydroxyalkanoate synthesis regulator phasin